MGCERRKGILAAIAVTMLVAGPGTAQQSPKASPTPPTPKPPLIHVTVVVNHVSQRPGPIDPAAAKLERHLRRDFKYKSVRVIQNEKMALLLNQTGSMTLPTGKFLKIKPRKVGERGVLMSVEVEGTLRTNLRVPNHHQVVIGAQNYEDGKLVITLEPEYELP